MSDIPSFAVAPMGWFQSDDGMTPQAFAVADTYDVAVMAFANSSIDVVLCVKVPEAAWCTSVYDANVFFNGRG